MLENGHGLLPQDRTHVLKLSGYRAIGSGVTVGASLLWQSGTPINEFGATEVGGSIYGFLQKRGTAGRTPSIWDLNFRVQYDLAASLLRSGSQLRPRLIVDLMHVASQRKPLAYDEVHYFALDGEGHQTQPNPNYLKPVHYQPPMAVRLGVEIDF
jgi:hypothetical protein